MSLFKRNKAVKSGVNYKLKNHVPVGGRSLPGLSSHQVPQATTVSPPPKQEPPSQRSLESDPQACLEVFESHWQQAIAIMIKNGSVLSPAQKPRLNQADDVSAVIHYVDQMMLLLVEERSDGQGPILQFLLADDVLEKLLTWCIQNVEFTDKLRLHQLKMYDMLISQSHQDLLIHKPVIRPLLKLLSCCAEHPNAGVERHLILLLHQLCVCLTQMPELVELFFSASLDQGPTRFLMFSLLVPYIHRDGDVGQQARDALLLIMALSSKDDRIGRYIAENSDFCPVLATGLSGLYSILPRKLEVPSDDWCQITEEDVASSTDLKMFLYSLEFCNAVTQVAHCLVSKQLLKYIYNGFLVPVLGPALHQTSLEEVIAATAYLDLFLRRVTEPALICTFLKFILMEKNDDMPILESLITRIHGSSRLCMVTLALFHTLVELNCEDVMYQLVFKYLIPCTHVMVSQRRAVKDIDLYSKTAEKFLTLIPACCVPDVTDSPPEGASAPSTPESFSGRSSRSSSPDVMARGSLGTKLEHFETSYTEYLEAAKEKIMYCRKACCNWVFRYDGDNPSPTHLQTLDSSIIEEERFLSENSDNNQTDSNRDKTFHSAKTPEELQNGDISSESIEFVKTNTKFQEKDSESLKNFETAPQTAQKITNSGTRAASELEPADTIANQFFYDKHDLVTSSSSTSVNSLISSTDFTDLESFVNSLKRVKTPDEFCDSVEETLRELDELMSSYKQNADTICERSSRTSSDSGTFEQFSPAGHPSDAGEVNIGANDSSLLRKRSESGDVEMKDRNGAMHLLTPQEGANGVIVHAKSESSLSELRQQTADQEGSSLRRHSSLHEKVDMREKGMGVVTPPKLSRQGSGGGGSGGVAFTPTKYNIGIPNIGPFLSSLLTKLETMMQNTLYVNLLLTGLIMRLACYPLPLLRSFLLNHALVFQPTVKSLIQVLSSVKHKVDCFSYTINNFEDLLLRARRFMAWREEVYLSTISGHGRSDSVTSLGKLNDPRKGRKGSLGDFLFRRNQSFEKGKPTKGALQRLQADGSTYRYVNIKAIEPAEKEETLKTKNAVYCALVLEEFLKELAAVAQEHSVLEKEDMDR